MYYYALAVVILLAISVPVVLHARHRHGALLVAHDKSGFVYRRTDGTLRRVPLGDPRMN